MSEYFNLNNVFPILDIGVGRKPRGDVNLDIDEKSLCDIIGDAQFLPFKSEIFPKVLCSQVLEHLDNPYLAIIDIRRILRNKGHAFIDVPKKLFTNNCVYLIIDFLINFPYSITPMSLKNLIPKIFKVRDREIKDPFGLLNCLFYPVLRLSSLRNLH